MIQKRTVIAAAVVLLFGIFFGVKAMAEEASPSKPYSGDFWSRSTLTGDWGGARNDLAAKGITFDLSLTQSYQGITSGGKERTWEYSGRGDLTIHASTQKLGLWKGGFLTMEVEGNYGKTVNGDTGALMPVNNSQLFPRPIGDNLNVPAFNYTQLLSPYIGITFGKIATLTSTAGDMNEFAHGKGDTQFMNMAFNLNPVVSLAVPYSTLGAGVIILPTKDPHEAVLGFMVLQTNGQASTTGFSDLNKDKLTFAGEGRIRTNFFGLTGHQSLGAAYSNTEYTSIDQNARVILQDREIEKVTGAWSISYNFDQYLYEPKKGKGIGIFGRFGVSDGNPNFMQYFYSIGVGGKGIIPGRPLDQFGLGYYYMDVKSPTFTGPFATRSVLGDEQGFEAYYNFAITPWMKLTPNIQIIRPAQKDVVVTTGGIHGISRESIGTVTVLATRLQFIF
jgi:porin